MKSESGEIIIAITLMLMAAMFIWAHLEDRSVRKQEGIPVMGCPEADYAKLGREFIIK